jgi:hypothetical protein
MDMRRSGASASESRIPPYKACPVQLALTPWRGDTGNLKFKQKIAGSLRRLAGSMPAVLAGEDPARRQ